MGLCIQADIDEHHSVSFALLSNFNITPAYEYGQLTSQSVASNSSAQVQITSFSIVTQVIIDVTI